jgi:hypothetical protein
MNIKRNLYIKSGLGCRQREDIFIAPIRFCQLEENALVSI